MTRTLPQWPTALLGDLIVSHDSLRMPVKESDRRPGQFPYYGASGVVDRVDRYIFDGEYLLIAEDGENLRTRNTPVAFLASGRFWVNNHAHVVQGNEKASTQYLAYALAAADIGSYLTGSTMPKLTQANMNRLRVVAPPRAIQDAIVQVLRPLDEKIELNRQMNETLEAMARALFKSWFVDFDPVRAKMAGHAPFGMDAATADLFPAGITDGIPDGWSVTKLRDLFDLQRGTTYESRLLGLPGPVLLGLGSIEPGGGFRGHKLKTYGGESPAKLLLRPGDMYVALKGATKDGSMVGSIARLPRSVPVGRLTQDTVKLVLHEQGARAQRLLYWALREPAYREYCAGRATGSAQVGLSREDFLGYSIVFPPANVLAVYDRIDESLIRRIEEAEDESRTLAELRDLLLPKLLSGELRIRDAERLVEPAL